MPLLTELVSSSLDIPPAATVTISCLSILVVLSTLLQSDKVKGSDFLHLLLAYINPAKGFQRLLYLVWGPKIIDAAYFACGRKSYKIPTPSNDLVLITTKELVTELNAASLKELSLHGIAKDLLQPQYTIPSFEWQDQRRGVEGSGYVRAIRALLTAHLPKFQPKLEAIIHESLAEEFGNAAADGWAHAQLFPVMKRTITKLNCFVFFGEELSRNSEFTAAALDFPQSTFIAAELLRCLPKFMCPLMLNIITKGRWAEKTLVRYLEPIVNERLKKRAQHSTESSSDAPVDCIQWLIDMSPRKNPWPASKVVGQILTLWFAAVFQPSMIGCYSIQDLCLHPQYVEPLRAEIKESLGEAGTNNVESLPLLDSYLRESIRVTNSDAITGRRKALEPFSFSDGTTANTGDWVSVPMMAMMRDPERYRNPENFDGYRFLRANELFRQGLTTPDVPEKAETRFTDANFDWPIWGYGQMTCPGRWYASLVLKLMLVCVLRNYECKMEAKPTWRSIFWRTGVVPRDGTVVMFRKIERDM